MLERIQVNKHTQLSPRVLRGGSMRLDHVEVFANQEAYQGPSHGVPQMIHHVGMVNYNAVSSPLFFSEGE